MEGNINQTVKEYMMIDISDWRQFIATYQDRKMWNSGDKILKVIMTFASIFAGIYIAAMLTVMFLNAPGVT